jgi:hypothetical protein
VPSITTWQRLEPRTRTSTLSALRARLYDPAWLLVCQRRLDEWRGIDGGSVIRADLDLSTSLVTHYRPGASATSAAVTAFPVSAPLEAFVEAETTKPAHTADVLFAARAGQCFLRSLGTVLGRRYRDDYVKHHPLSAPAATVLDVLDNASRRLLDVLVGHVPNGHTLYTALAATVRPASGTPALPLEPAINSNDTNTVLAVAGAWLDWYDAMRPPPRPQAWDPEHLEYRFTVSAPARATTGTAEVALSAHGFAGGRLDWPAFDIDASAALGAAAATETWPTVTAIPTPVRFPGMPHSRYWEMEDRATNLASIDAAPDDLGRLALLEFALVYGNDFLHIPFDLPVGSLCWIDKLTVTNTFGETTEIASVERAPGAYGSWSMFRLSGDGDLRSDFLFLAPTLDTSLHGPALEEILLMRDEMANTAWAVEQRAQTEAGTTSVPREASGDRQRRQPLPAEPSAPPPGPKLAYRLATKVPDHWHPLIPVIVSRALAGVSWNNVALELQGLHPVHGQLLRPPTTGPTRIAEEEVPRSGVVLTRTWQRARWIDGTIHTWIERRKRSGRGEGSSGQRYDAVDTDKVSDSDN